MTDFWVFGFLIYGPTLKPRLGWPHFVFFPWIRYSFFRRGFFVIRRLPITLMYRIVPTFNGRIRHEGPSSDDEVSFWVSLEAVLGNNCSLSVLLLTHEEPLTELCGGSSETAHFCTCHVYRPCAHAHHVPKRKVTGSHALWFTHFVSLFPFFLSISFFWIKTITCFWTWGIL